MPSHRTARLCPDTPSTNPLSMSEIAISRQAMKAFQR
jgi:hypothetical protein